MYVIALSSAKALQDCTSKVVIAQGFCRKKGFTGCFAATEAAALADSGHNSAPIIVSVRLLAPWNI